MRFSSSSGCVIQTSQIRLPCLSKIYSRVWDTIVTASDHCPHIRKMDNHGSVTGSVHINSSQHHLRTLEVLPRQATFTLKSESEQQQQTGRNHVVIWLSACSDALAASILSPHIKEQQEREQRAVNSNNRLPENIIRCENSQPVRIMRSQATAVAAAARHATN
eukprot:scaffold140529_cov33-Prasinocladus_malaysianus.AAC.1